MPLSLSLSLSLSRHVLYQQQRSYYCFVLCVEAPSPSPLPERAVNVDDLPDGIERVVVISQTGVRDWEGAASLSH